MINYIFWLCIIHSFHTVQFNSTWFNSRCCHKAALQKDIEVDLYVYVWTSPRWQSQQNYDMGVKSDWKLNPTCSGWDQTYWKEVQYEPGVKKSPGIRTGQLSADGLIKTKLNELLNKTYFCHLHAPSLFLHLHYIYIYIYEKYRIVTINKLHCDSNRTWRLSFTQVLFLPACAFRWKM